MATCLKTSTPIFSAKPVYISWPDMYQQHSTSDIMYATFALILHACATHFPFNIFFRLSGEVLVRHLAEEVILAIHNLKC